MDYNNPQIAASLNAIADLLEIEGENIYRIRAYRKAARAILKIDFDIKTYFESGAALEDIPSVGRGIALQIKYILTTGMIPDHSQLKIKHTPSLFNELKQVRGLGKKRIQTLQNELNISTIAALKNAIEQGKIRHLKNFSEKIEKKLLIAIQNPKPYEKFLRWFQARPALEFFLKAIRTLDAVHLAECAGSFRRKAELVGNQNIIICLKNNINIFKKIAEMPGVREIIHTENEFGIIAASGLKINFYIVPETYFYSYLLYYTGSLEHVKKLPIFAKKNKKMPAAVSESDLYKKIKLPYIPPELRENRGEIAAAQNNNLPRLIERQDLRGDLHCHTNETDGRDDLETMVEAAKSLGYEYIAITDHSKSLKITNGLDEKRLLAQIKLIDKLNEKLTPFRILKSIEMDILIDGTLDFSNDILKELDVTVCSIHSRFRLSKAEQTERIIRAMDNPYFNILGHMTGRLIQSRPPYDLDVEKILIAAHERGCFIELNSQPYRLDLNDIYCLMAKKIGVKIAISSDAHSVSNFNYVEYGINQARRGWLTKDDVINTRNLNNLLKLFKRY